MAKLRTRDATAGEVCLCGRPAKTVTEMEDSSGSYSSPEGWCGGPCNIGACPFCKGAGHVRGLKCVNYVLSPSKDWSEPTEIN